MNRHEFIQRRVLNAIRDDFENVDQVILPKILRDCGKLGFVIERSTVVSSLASLVEDGTARAYDLHNLAHGDPFSGELRGMPALDQVGEDFKTYFYITKEGMEFHCSNTTWWPFDDDDEPLPNWRLDDHPASG